MHLHPQGYPPLHRSVSECIMGGKSDEKWKLLFNEHTRAPIYTVSHYIAYLRRFVADTEGSRSGSASGSGSNKSTKSGKDGNSKRPADAIHPLSYFLRKLMLDLKVSYDSFVRDFVRPPNDGLSLLLRLLANLQSGEGGKGTKGKSSGTLNRSTSRLEDYKRSITDEHDCLLSIKYTLRVQAAVVQLARDGEGLQRIAGAAMGTNSKARVTCLEILTLCAMTPGGVESVLEAFTVMRLKHGESVRFKMLVSMLHTRAPSQVLFQVTALKLFNTLLNFCPTANIRVYLQQELLTAGLDLQFLSDCAQGDGLEYDDLKREIYEWRARYIDVDLLLKRLKTEQRGSLGGFFSGPDGPLQVSSRRPSVRSQHGTSQAFRRDFAGSNRIISHGGFVSSHQFHSTEPGHPAEAEVNGNGILDFDDESEIISVSRQQSPEMHRKFESARDRQPTGRSTGVHMAFSLSAHDLSKPPAYQRNGFNFARTDSQISRDTTVDAYGLVIHRRESTTVQEKDGRRDGGLRPHLSSHLSPAQDNHNEGMYSNWKLRYFSTPTITTTHVDDDGGGENYGSHPNRTDYPPMTKPKPEAYDSGVYMNDEKRTHEVQTSIWESTYYPFGKRALYRGHDSRQLDTREATLQVREINSAQSYGDNQGVKKMEFLKTPEPDYSPVHTPRGSMRSLTTEVARVLQDFEKTLHAHDTSRPPSVIGPVAFV